MMNNCISVNPEHFRIGHRCTTCRQHRLRLSYSGHREAGWVLGQHQPLAAIEEFAGGVKVPGMAGGFR